MRPINGVVRRVKDGNLVIKLENGLTLQTPKAHGYGIGDIVYLAYDFTKNEIVKLLPPVCEEQEHCSTPVEEEHDSGIIEEYAEKSVPDPGALFPVCDGEITEISLEYEDGEINDVFSGSGALSLSL